MLCRMGSFSQVSKRIHGQYERPLSASKGIRHPRISPVVSFLVLSLGCIVMPSQRLLSPLKTSDSLESAVLLKSHRKLELEHVIEVWRSLYISIATQLDCPSKSFSEELSLNLNGWLDEKIRKLDSDNHFGPMNQDVDLLCLCGEVVVCVLEQSMTDGLGFTGISTTQNGGWRTSIGVVNNMMGLIARFLTLLWRKESFTPSIDLAVFSRVFFTLVRFVGCLYFKGSVISFMEVMSGPFYQWISHVEVHDENGRRPTSVIMGQA